MTECPVVIRSDVLCPWCFVCKRSLDQAAKVLDDEYKIKLRFEWEPHLLRPQLPMKSRERTALIARPKWQRVVEAGKEAGIHFPEGGPRFVANTLKAHVLLEEAKRLGVQHEVADRLFVAEFEQGQDVGDDDVLVQLLPEANDEQQLRAALNDESRWDAVRAECNKTREDFVGGVPHVTIDGRFGITGAHTPDAWVALVRRIVGKRSRL